MPRSTLVTFKDYAIDSGERITEVTEDRIITDHLARYNYAASFFNETFSKRTGSLFIADVFCGVGYGSNILAKKTQSSIWGIDGSIESIFKATKSFPRANLFFSSGIFPFTLPIDRFDGVCSFESIEHVLDYELFSRTLVNSIKPGGYLLVSCPNSERNDLSVNPYEWHYKHMAPKEFSKNFEELGMTLIRNHSTHCVVTNTSRKVVGVNHFAIPKNEIMNHTEGDSLFFIFEKTL